MLLASVYAIDGDRVLADWRIPISDLRPGWLPLRLPTSLAHPYRSLELHLSSNGDESEPPRLSLVATGTLDEFAAKKRTGALADPLPGRMLAIRLWGSLPGVPWEPLGNAALHPLHDEMIVPILDYAVARVRPTRNFDAPFRWFGSLPGGKVLLHPLRDRVAAAVIPLPTHAALLGIGCEVVIEDPRRRMPIACKLVIAAPELTVDQAENDEEILASSGWTVLTVPERPYRLAAAMDQPYPGPVNLHLFTRIADDGPDFYGRTVFGRFELRMGGKAAQHMLPVMASLG
jgi:hypothetical protein